MPALADQVAALQELDRRECFADPCVFMGLDVEIEDPDGTIIKLKLWLFQAQAVKALHEDRAVIVLKARRLGLSWIFLAYALWLAVTQQGIRVLILCKTEVMLRSCLTVFAGCATGSQRTPLQHTSSRCLRHRRRHETTSPCWMLGRPRSRRWWYSGCRSL